MVAPTDDHTGFAPDDDAPIPYMRAHAGILRRDRLHHALSLGALCRGAVFSRCASRSRSHVHPCHHRCAVRPAKGDQGPGAKYNGGAKFYSVYDGDTSKPHDLRISHIAYDRMHTSAEDSGTWFPLPQLHRLAAEKRIGDVAPRFSARRPTGATA